MSFNDNTSFKTLIKEIEKHIEYTEVTNKKIEELEEQIKNKDEQIYKLRSLDKEDSVVIKTKVLEFVSYKRPPFMYNKITGLVIKSNSEKIIVSKIIDDTLLPLKEDDIRICEERKFK